MTAYSIIMFAAAALFLAFGIALYKGNPKLIHDYHQANVAEAERPQYSRSLAAGMLVLCATLLISGTIALFGAHGLSLLVFFLGLAVSIVILATVQKKYGGGIF